MHYNCLIVDDEKELAQMTVEYFEMFEVKTCYVTTADECYEFLGNNSTDLILLDINLGDGSGFDVCKKIREKYRLPILFISARQSDDDILIALSIGGDDYIKKPYSLSVLLAKVKVTLKRIAESAGASSQAEAGVPSDKEAMSLDPSTMSVMVRGEHIPLKAREYALLEALYKHKNSIVSKDRLFEEVWGDGYYSDGTLNVHIRKLREKIEEDPNDPAFIKTVWGTGYILEL
ncbi:MAG: response regulator transcription factor [Lachnospiraceae bacterium]|nr:response regulator transcription factor [Lachnospiraceae bacterium]